MFHIYLPLRWTAWRKRSNMQKKTVALLTSKSPYYWTTLADQEVGLHQTSMLLFGPDLCAHRVSCAGQINSRTMLLPLLQRFTSQMRVSLYHTPDLRGLLRLLVPQRFNETIGVQHIKVYLFDDSVIISGYVEFNSRGLESWTRASKMQMSPTSVRDQKVRI